MAVKKKEATLFLYPLTSFSMVLHKITAAALPLHTLIKPYRTNK